jgi:hypothetical protein
MSTTASVKRIHYRSPTPAPASAILSFVNRILNGKQREEIGRRISPTPDRKVLEQQSPNAALILSHPPLPF